MKCGLLNCNQELKYELLQKTVVLEKAKKTYYYAGVKCSQCEFTHRISPMYLKKKKAIEQVEAHSYRTRSTK